MTTQSAGTELELVADHITQTIFSVPFAQASRHQQDQALTCAGKILTALTSQPCSCATSEVAA